MRRGTIVVTYAYRGLTRPGRDGMRLRSSEMIIFDLFVLGLVRRLMTALDLRDSDDEGGRVRRGSMVGTYAYRGLTRQGRDRVRWKRRVGVPLFGFGYRCHCWCR